MVFVLSHWLMVFLVTILTRDNLSRDNLWLVTITQRDVCLWVSRVKNSWQRLVILSRVIDWWSLYCHRLVTISRVFVFDSIQRLVTISCDNTKTHDTSLCHEWQWTDKRHSWQYKDTIQRPSMNVLSQYKDSWQYHESLSRVFDSWQISSINFVLLSRVKDLLVNFEFYQSCWCFTGRHCAILFFSQIVFNESTLSCQRASM